MRHFMSLLNARLNWMLALHGDDAEHYRLARIKYMAAIRKAERFLILCARARS